MMVRLGRRNPRALWLQVGGAPDDEADVFLGSTTTSEAASALVALANAGLVNAPHAGGGALQAAREADPR